MSDDDAPRLPKILRELNEEIGQILGANRIFDVTTYGWIDHDTPDPTYLGHAIWQTTPPFQPDFPALFSGGAVRYLPTEADEILTLSGEDFVGTMMFARRSIGLALCYAQNTAPGLLDNCDEFWHEYTTSLQWLDIASDRLRGFFVMAAFGRRKKKYQKSKKSSGRRSQYSRPFEVALREEDGPAKEYLTSLLPIAGRIEKYRLERHRIVHEVATEVAHTSISVLKGQRELARAGKPKQIPEITFEQLQEATSANLFSNGTTDPVQTPKEWYLSLIEASNLIFQFECCIRSTS